VPVVAALNVIAGIWLIISPWVIGYDSGDATWNPIVFGALVVVFALGRIAMPARTAALSALNAVIGVWLRGAQWSQTYAHGTFATTPGSPAVSSQRDRV
jgi:SPW repeat